MNRGRFRKEAPAEFNQEFRAYEQVAKLQRYRLAEGEDEEFDEEFVLEPCDLSLLRSPDASDRARLTRELGESLEDTGFAVLTGHGVDPALYAEAHRNTRRFFESHSLSRKLRYRARRQGSVNQGYFPMRETTVIHPDLVEGWVFCRRAFDLEGNPSWDESRFWPSPGWEPFFRRVVVANEALIHPIMRTILDYLGEDASLFDERLEATNFGFRLNYYPAMEGAGKNAPGRMLGHEDVDLFTILPAALTLAATCAPSWASLCWPTWKYWSGSSSVSRTASRSPNLPSAPKWSANWKRRSRSRKGWRPENPCDVRL